MYFIYFVLKEFTDIVDFFLWRQTKVYQEKIIRVFSYDFTIL